MWSESATRRRRKIGLTPLIDVVFQLLIFFMLASSFSQLRTISFASEEGRATKHGEESGVVVRVHGGGSLEISGQSVDANDLRAALRAALSGRPEVGVLIVAEADVALQDMIVAVDAAHAEGAAEISFGRP